MIKCGYSFICQEMLTDELRTTKRALWLARADKCLLYAAMLSYAQANDDVKVEELSKSLDMFDKFQKAERKCREKAEEYK